MIPVALSGDRSYNPDTIRKYVISGNRTIPGASTIHFDEIAKNKIFQSIDKIRGMKLIIKESYVSLKNRLGKIPSLYDFYIHNEVDPLVIIKEYKTYFQFLESVEKTNYICDLSAEEKMIIEYLSKTILSGVRPEELEILRLLLEQKSISINDFKRFVNEKYDRNITNNQVDYAIDVLQGKFVSNDNEYQKYKNIEVISNDHNNFITRMLCYEERLRHDEFRQMVEDIIQVGLTRYEDKFMKTDEIESPFVLYEKYSRRDVSLLMNCGKDLSSVMFGMKRIVDDVFIFVTYHKEENTDEDEYIFAHSDTELLTEADLENKDDSQLRLGLNEIYARHHCTFKTPEIADYFKSKSWYSADETLTSEMMNNHMSEYFNEIELKNISFIQAHR